MALQPSKLTLYSRVTSSCTARVQIAANLKKIPLTINPCDGKKLFKDKSYLEMNPNGTVPTLVADYENGESLTMSQSLSMLDFLEDSYPGGMRLIPPVTDMKARCKARDLALLIACDIQPLQSHRTGDKLRQRGLDTIPWTQSVLSRGMKQYEAVVQQSAGKYSVGDELSIADICLVSLVKEAYKVNLDFQNPETSTKTLYPIIQRIVKVCEELPAFRLSGMETASRYRHQDTDTGEQISRGGTRTSLQRHLRISRSSARETNLMPKSVRNPRMEPDNGVHRAT